MFRLQKVQTSINMYSYKFLTLKIYSTTNTTHQRWKPKFCRTIRKAKASRFIWFLAIFFTLKCTDNSAKSTHIIQCQWQRCHFLNKQWNFSIYHVNHCQIFQINSPVERLVAFRSCITVGGTIARPPRINQTSYYVL